MSSSVTTSGLNGWTPVFLNVALMSSNLLATFPLPPSFLLCPTGLQSAKDNNIETLVNVCAVGRVTQDMDVMCLGVF
ncbi:hypothetical protein M405DRAFT_349105 [Rhizopogon salebrosus TDB-379]|nr:hypothetical protein M405DRAFT_349105 [Rhizopogon salebrosus TDB-379]